MTKEKAEELVKAIEDHAMCVAAVVFSEGSGLSDEMAKVGRYILSESKAKLVALLVSVHAG